MNPIRLACTLAFAGALAGCAVPATPLYDATFGDSVRQARGLQVMNPDGARNPDPVAGIDARAGRSGIERYQESFRAPPPTFEILNIGGSVVGGGGGGAVDRHGNIGGAMKRMTRFQRGSVAVMAGLTIVVLIGFAGLAIDLGRMFVIKAELQTAMDGCALAAATQLRPGLADDAALDRAIAYGKAPANLAGFQAMAVNGDQIQFSFAVQLAGPYTSYSYKAGGVGGPGGLARTANYVRCTYPMNDVPVVFMRVFDAVASTTTVAATAVATLAPSQTNCGFPVAVCRDAGASAGSSPPWGLTPGQWVGGLAGPGGGSTNPPGCGSGVGTGNFCWLDFSPPSGGASELAALIQGGGQCNMNISNPVGQTGVAASLGKAWNTRFGIYAPGGGSGGDPTTARPDLTGYSYTAANWPSQFGAYSDFTAHRTLGDPFNPSSGVSISPSTPITSAQHKLYGRDRRLVLAPIVNCSTFNTSQTVSIDAWACVLLLAPMATPPVDAQLEYLGLASIPGTPCATSGLGGGTAGPLVPVLVQ